MRASAKDRTMQLSEEAAHTVAVSGGSPAPGPSRYTAM